MSLGGLLFSEEKMGGGRESGGQGSSGGTLGGIDGGETVVGMYHIREESIFNSK